MPADGAGAAVSRLGDYKVIVFDCDGVLLDSNQLKTGVFREVLREHGYDEDQVAAFSAFQNSNFGMSRYRLFEALISGQFGFTRDVAIEDLLASFGERCRIGYLDQPETPSLRDALDRAGAGRALYVASGSDQEELRYVLATRRLGDYFVEIYGSPSTKADILRRIRDDRRGAGAGDEPMLFIGDAFADMRAAQEVGIDFLFMAAYSTVRPELEDAARAAGFDMIETLADLY